MADASRPRTRCGSCGAPTIARGRGSGAASRCCPACSRWPTCSAATRASSTRCAASTRRGALHRLRHRPRHARRPHRAADRHDERLRRAVRLAGRRHLVRHRAGDPVVRVGPGVARPPRVGGGLPLRRGGGDAAGALQHPERGSGGDKRYFVGMPSPAAAAVAGRDRLRVSRGASTTTAPRCRRWRWCSMPALLMVSTIRFRSFKTIDLQARRPYTVLICRRGRHRADRDASADRARGDGLRYLASAFVEMAIDALPAPRRPDPAAVQPSTDRCPRTSALQDAEHQLSVRLKPDATACAECHGVYAAGSVIVTVVPTPRSLLDVDRAAVQLDVPLGDRQAEAGAGRLGREVRLEDPRQRLRHPSRRRCR